MTNAPARDPLADHLLTPQNAALLLIDYQPARLAGVHSMDCDLLVKNGVSILKTIKTFQVSVAYATINVATGRGKPTIPELAPVLLGLEQAARRSDRARSPAARSGAVRLATLDNDRYAGLRWT
jgi:nicotinamidase-related amidase